MKLEYVPLLQIQRDLYEMPRGGARFQAYIDTLRDQSGGMALPLAGMNPMGKSHLPALLDDYLALDSERIAAEVVTAVQDHLSSFSGNFQVALVMADDLKGGWTNRYTTEYTHLCGTRPYHRRGWFVGHLWSSEVATAERLKAALILAIYRGAYITKHGDAETLGGIIQQEAFVWQMGSKHHVQNHLGVLELDDLGYTADVLHAYAQSQNYGEIMAALFGDTAARQLGYQPLGLSDYAGLRLARQRQNL